MHRIEFTIQNYTNWLNDLSNHTFVTTHTPTYKGGKTITKILAEVQPSSNPKNILDPNTASLHILRCNVLQISVFSHSLNYFRETYPNFPETTIFLIKAYPETPDTPNFLIKAYREISDTLNFLIKTYRETSDTSNFLIKAYRETSDTTNFLIKAYRETPDTPTFLIMSNRDIRDSLNCFFRQIWNISDIFIFQK